jgi:hypothetical protein
MKITMVEGLEVTEEVLALANSYNWFTAYIDSYSDRVRAEEQNIEIELKLEELGVINFENN